MSAKPARLRARWLAIAGAFAAACGGGGGRPSLRVVAYGPEGGGVEPATAVTVTFDRDPDTATLRPEAFVVRDAAGPLVGQYSYDAATRVWRCEFAAGWPRGAALRVEVSADVRALDGAPLAARAWQFSVRQGTPAVPVVVRQAAVATFGMHVEAAADDGLLVCNGEAWPLAQGNVGALETVPVSAAYVLTRANDGTAVCAGYLLGPPGSVLPALAQRSPAGSWGLLPQLAIPVGYTMTSTALLGNERGDLLVHRAYTQASATWREHQVWWATKGVGSGWQNTPPRVVQADERFAAALAGDGSVGILRDEGEFVLAERFGAASGDAIYTLAQGALLQVETIAAAADGGLRAIWHAPGAAWQSFAPPGGAFAAATMVPIAVSAGTRWRSAPTGALVGWLGPRLVRSEAGSAQWTAIELAQAPLAVAISPRGEAAWVTFEGPDQWRVQRWPVGSLPTAAVPVATVPSAFAANRDAALSIDAGGRIRLAATADVPADLFLVEIF